MTFMDALKDRIFPPGPPRDGHVLRLSLVDSWESQFLGLGRLTAFLTPRLLSQSHAVDDMGLSVLFLQRHRVEVGLKLVLERSSSKRLRTHNIDALLSGCTRNCRAVGEDKIWQAFHKAHAPFVELMHEVDPGAGTWRYPEDPSGAPWRRERYVDLAALESAGAAFETGLRAVVGALAEHEDLPVDGSGAEEVARDLRRLAEACRRVLRVNHEALAGIWSEAGRLLAGRRRPSSAGADVHAAASAVEDVTAALVLRLDAMADRLERAYGLPRFVEQEAPPTTPMPRITTLEPRAFAAQQRAQIEWYGRRFAEAAEPISDPLIRLHKRTSTWTTPAARQIHLDVARYRSRLHTNWYRDG